jgi:hypothetical protein
MQPDHLLLAPGACHKQTRIFAGLHMPTSCTFGPVAALLQLVELELQRNPSSPAVRLDTSAAVAAEVVAVLRQGPTYVLPSDERLLAAVKQQLDILGVQLQPPAGEQAYLFVPTYDLAEDVM